MSHTQMSIFETAGVGVEEAQGSPGHYRWQNITVYLSDGSMVELTLHLAPGFEGLPAQSRSMLGREE